MSTSKHAAEGAIDWQEFVDVARGFLVFDEAATKKVIEESSFIGFSLEDGLKTAKKALERASMLDVARIISYSVTRGTSRAGFARSLGEIELNSSYSALGLVEPAVAKRRRGALTIGRVPLLFPLHSLFILSYAKEHMSSLSKEALDRTGVEWWCSSPGVLSVVPLEVSKKVKEEVLKYQEAFSSILTEKLSARRGGGKAVSLSREQLEGVCDAAIAQTVIPRLTLQHIVDLGFINKKKELLVVPHVGFDVDFYQEMMEEVFQVKAPSPITDNTAPSTSGRPAKTPRVQDEDDRMDHGGLP